MLKDWLEKLTDFIRIRSLAEDKNGVDEAVAFLSSLFKHTGLECKIFNTPGNPIVYAEYKVGEDKPTLLFYNHYDVQPAKIEEGWSSEPFDLVKRKNRIYGRGVADTKGNIIARIAAVKELLEADELKINVKFIIEGEEEIGSPNLKEFVNERKKELHGDLCIWEFGGRDNRRGKIELTLGVKGIIFLRLKVKGNKELHSSLGGIAYNPIWRIVHALCAIHELEKEIIHEEIPDWVANCLKTIPFDQEDLQLLGIKKLNPQVEKFSFRALISKLIQDTAININSIFSGYSEGVKTAIPKESIAYLDIRFSPFHNIRDVEVKLRNLLSTKFPDVELDILASYPGAISPISHPYIKVVIENIKGVYGEEPIIYPYSPASGPMYLFSSLMPTVALGVGDKLSSPHGVDESISLNDLYLGVKFIKHILRNFNKFK